MVFVDFKKTYDTVPREEMIEVLQQTTLNRKYIRTIKGLYANTTTAIKIGTKLSNNFKTSKDRLQGCCLSLYSKFTLHFFKYYLNRPLQLGSVGSKRPTK